MGAGTTKGNGKNMKLSHNNGLKGERYILLKRITLPFVFV